MKMRRVVTGGSASQIASSSVAACSRTAAADLHMSHDERRRATSASESIAPRAIKICFTTRIIRQAPVRQGCTEPYVNSIHEAIGNKTKTNRCKLPASVYVSRGSSARSDVQSRLLSAALINESPIRIVSMYVSAPIRCQNTSTRWSKASQQTGKFRCASNDRTYRPWGPFRPPPKDLFNIPLE